MIVLLLPGITGAEDVTFQDIPAKVAIQVDGAGKGKAEIAVTLLPGDVVRVELIAPSGTGYTWQLEEAPNLVMVNKSGPQPVQSEKGLVGAPYRETYVLQARETVGNETLHFILVRPWENKDMAAKTLAISVTVKQQSAEE